MAREPCDGCGKSVTIAGGIANLWTFEKESTGGITLTFESDGTEHFLCFDCMERIPDDPTAADVAALPAHEAREGTAGEGDGTAAGEGEGAPTDGDPDDA